jgi:DNA adenine methylase
MGIRPAVKYHGGKYRIRQWILDQIPDHRIYVEPFGGAGAILLNKQPSEIEVYGDSEYSIWNLMSTLRDFPQHFTKEIKKVKYDKQKYLEMREIYRSDEFINLSRMKQAVITYSVRRMSRGGLCGTFCWSKRMYANGMIPAEIHSWNTMFEVLPKIGERLKNVQIIHNDWSGVMKLFDLKDTVTYLDPPYPKSTRVFKTAYLKEMTIEQHRELGRYLLITKSKILLSSYPSKLYDELFQGWRCEKKQAANHSSHEKIKEKKTECLWMNFADNQGA